MNKIIYILLVLIHVSCLAQDEESETVYMSVSPAVDTSDKGITELIHVVSEFLRTKNESLTSHPSWLQADFERYVVPYKDLFKIEQSRWGNNHFRPTLMEVITLSSNEKIAKIGFVGYNRESGENVIRAIYNILAIRVNEVWKLKRLTDYCTKDWSVFTEGSITYHIPKEKTPDNQEIARQKEAIREVCLFFETPEIPITYYSCESLKQIFEIKGFDYLPNMYFDTIGGMVDPGNIVYSGNDSEYYMHEIMHVYSTTLFPSLPPFLNEGLATYAGGSGLDNYAKNREYFKLYIQENSIQLAEHLEPYERLFMRNGTPVPYMIGAVICERVFRVHGKEGLIGLLRSDKELWETLNTYGFTQENLSAEIKKEIELPGTWLLEKNIVD